MSRIGNKAITLPGDVTASISGNEVTVKGPKGELRQRVHADMRLDLQAGVLRVSRPDDGRHNRALHGLTRALLNNMVEGVNRGYEIRLEVQGTGYRAEMQGDELKLVLGFSHDVVVAPPPSVKFQVEDRGRIIVLTSIDKALVGQVAADIRRLRPPEPYQGKGIRYVGEVVRHKAGKAGKVGV